VLNAGDTRVYRKDANGLTQLSTDHTLLNEYLAQGKAIPKDLRLETLTNTITRFVGSKKKRFDPTIAGDVTKGIEEGIYLLCSDGAYKDLGDSKISRILELPLELEARCKLLYSMALKSGSDDDISIVLVEVDPCLE
jgi:protein phosphatase